MPSSINKETPKRDSIAVRIAFKSKQQSGIKTVKQPRVFFMETLLLIQIKQQPVKGSPIQNKFNRPCLKGVLSILGRTKVLYSQQTPLNMNSTMK